MAEFEMQHIFVISRMNATEQETAMWCYRAIRVNLTTPLLPAIAQQPRLSGNRKPFALIISPSCIGHASIYLSLLLYLSLRGGHMRASFSHCHCLSLICINRSLCHRTARAVLLPFSFLVWLGGGRASQLERYQQL